MMKKTITIDKANVSIQGDKIVFDMDAEQLKKLLDNDSVLLSELEPKDKFKIGDTVFTVLNKIGDIASVITADFKYENMEFGISNNWETSPLRKLINGEFLNEIANIIGNDNIVEMERDLTSLDGLDDYGTCRDKVSLLTAAEYAKYHKILGLKSHYPDWWWTITPFSTPSNDYSRDVCYVFGYGILDWGVCVSCDGVRPFLNLKSNIYVTKVQD